MRTLAFLAALMFLVMPVRAQDDPRPDDPRVVLESAARALTRAPGFQAEFAIESLASGALAKLDFTGEGRFYWRRGTGPDDPNALRVIGTYRRASSAEPEAVDLLLTPDAVRLIDDERRRLVVRNPAKPIRESNALDQIATDFLLTDRPFATELTRAELTLEPDQEVAGVPCRVVLATLPKPADGGERPAGEHDTTRWFIGTTDALPRRVERVNQTLLGNVGSATTIRELDTEAAIASARFEMPAPEGYRVDSNVAGVESTAAVRPNTGTGGTTPQPAARPRRTPAPLFDLTTQGGERVTLDSQMTAERATVLYFFGTWSLACEPYHTRLAGLAEAFEGQPVDFVAVAVRERTPAAAARLFTSSTSVRVVTDPGEAPDAFRVLVYPTFIVIDPRGGRVADERPARDDTPEALMERVRTAVDDALE